MHFSIELFEEHLEEAAILAEQRYALLDDIELQWTDIQDYEVRWEAHIDALVLGDSLALDVCRNRLIEQDDPWEVHAALVVMCRHRLGGEIFEFIGQLDEDSELESIVARALRHEIPSQWQEQLLQQLAGSSGAGRSVLLQIAAYRRFAVDTVCVEELSSEAGNRIHAAWALGRIGNPQHGAVLQQLLEPDDAELAVQSAIARLRLGDSTVVNEIINAAPFSTWPTRCLGLCGAQQAVNLLMDRAGSENCVEDAVIALGQLGELGAIRILVKLLETEKLAEAAATALNIITGAAKYQEVFVEEQFESGDMFEEELIKFQQTGELPRRSDGSPFGNWERRPNSDPATWRAWLDENKAAFSRQHRWRLGRPLSPSAMVESLRSPDIPLNVRGRLHDELVCRYQMPVPFEHDLPVRQQEVLLEKMSAWAASVDTNFQAGTWYFAGEEIS